MTPSLHDTIIRMPGLRLATGLGRSTLYALISRGAFPAPVRLSTGAVGWRGSDVAAWIEARPPARG